MKPLGLDLCKGLGGWTKGLLAAGWDVIGVDVEDWSHSLAYVKPTGFIQADVREIAKDVQAYFPALKFDLVVASPPCQEFSITRQPFHKPHVERLKREGPDKSIWRACVKIAADLKAPLILENVGGANDWMGRATWHYGSYYFWGEIPALQPIPFLKENGVMSHRKGFQRSAKTTFGKDRDDQIAYISKLKKDPKDGLVYIGNAQARKVDHFHAGGERGRKGWAGLGEKERANGLKKANMSSRKVWAATVAMIPEELSTWIGECFYPQEMKGH